MKHVIVIASGPSASRAMKYLEPDIREAQTDGRCLVIVINSAWTLYLHADYLVAADRGWWDAYGRYAKNVAGTHITIDSVACIDHDPRLMPCEDGAGLPSSPRALRGRSNSGMLGISLAAGMLGAKHIYLIGFDNKPDATFIDHFHSNHPPAIRKAMPYAYWRDEFKKIAADALERGIEIKHLCNPDSALDFFARLGPGQSSSALHHIPLE